MTTLDNSPWSPERKVVGAAAATVLLGFVQLVTGVEFAPAFEGGVAVLVAYFIPNR